MKQGRSWRELVDDRLSKDRLYNTPEYWNMKARVYPGLARSNWPSNAYNHEVHARQMSIVDRALPDVSGWQVLDVGCGTGRTSVHLGRRGALPSGFDFAAEAVAEARRDVAELGIRGDFLVQSVLDLEVRSWHEKFDALISLGCLTLACRDADEFELALSRLLVTAKPGARLLFIEPIHRSRLLARMLRMDVADWVRRCAARGLSLEGAGPLCFVPARFVLAYRPLPKRVAQPIFQLGERALSARGLARLSDYTWLLFRRSASHART